jgi:hypothetical protein
MLQYAVTEPPPAPALPSDVDAATRGDRQAFERLYRSHVGRVHALCLVLAIGLMPATAAGATVALDTIVDVDPRAKVTISQRTGRLIVRGRPTTTPPGIQVTGADVRVGGDRRSRQLVIVTGRQRRDRDTVAELLVPASVRLVIQSSTSRAAPATWSSAAPAAACASNRWRAT